MSAESLKMADFSRPILLVSLATPENRSRSMSPHTPSPTRKLRGVRLFRAISRKLSRRNMYEDDSTDSEPSSSSEGNSGSGSGNNSPDSSMCKESSESTLRKVFQSFSLMSDRRSSDSNSDSSSSSRKKSSNNMPKKILRQPVSYTYVRGLSGLPTIRVPRTKQCCGQSALQQR